MQHSSTMISHRYNNHGSKKSQDGMSTIILLCVLASSWAILTVDGLATEEAVHEASSWIVPPASLKSAPYAEWAHYHWVWLAHGGNGSADLIQLAEDYIAHNISVGAIDADSTWETGFNDFIPTTTMYPNITSFVDMLHSMNIRIIFWITSMVDTDSPNFQEGYDAGYYINDAFGKPGKLNWWHGTGCLIDYTNPKAVDWWHAQMDNMLNVGIDGWKCDGTDPYILELVEPHASTGPITYREYADLYYGDFFNYTRRVLGDDRMIMSRPVDGYGPLYLKFSPKYVMTSGWVGDQDDTFEGLQQALKRYLLSAWAGYANYGSDIGGYRTPQANRASDLLLRWAQLGAFSPLMENGGNGEHRPWLINVTESQFVTDVYRTFVDIHYSLVPYLLTVGTNAIETGTSSMHPLVPHQSEWEIVIDDFQPAYYDYLLGNDILVSPIVQNSTTNSTLTKVHFLAGASWSYWFDTSRIFKGENKSVELDIPLSEFAAFHRVGAMIPLNFTKGGNEITISIIAPQEGVHESELREFGGHGIIFGYSLDATSRFEFTCSAHSSKYITLHLDQIIRKPTSVLISNASGNTIELPEIREIETIATINQGFCFIQNKLYINPGSLTAGARVVISSLIVRKI